MTRHAFRLQKDIRNKNLRAKHKMYENLALEICYEKGSNELQNQEGEIVTKWYERR